MAYIPPSASTVNFDLVPNTPSRTSNFDFSGAVVGPTGSMKVWTGSDWALKPVKYWTGSIWVQKPLKYWDGSTWITSP